MNEFIEIAEDFANPLDLVRESSQNMASLPVIVDDALVNSDPRRARAAAQGLASLADTNQVLLFICHSALVEQF